MTAMGQERRIGAVCNISALPPTSRRRLDIVGPPLSARTGREQSQQTMGRGCRLVDHLVGAQQQQGGQLDTDRLRGLKIDDQLELGGLLDR
jgi:hypothetical protein